VWTWCFDTARSAPPVSSGACGLRAVLRRRSSAAGYRLVRTSSHAAGRASAELGRGKLSILGELHLIELCPGHPNTLILRNNLALAYHAVDDLGPVIPLCEATLAYSERMLGLDHSTTRGIRSNLDGGAMDLKPPLCSGYGTGRRWRRTSAPRQKRTFERWCESCKRCGVRASRPLVRNP
jgi:hypothetical protein